MTRKQKCPKEQVLALIRELADDASFDDIQYHLYVLQRINQGHESMEQDGGITQAEVEDRLRQKYVLGANWPHENAEAIRESNEWVEQNGLPLKNDRPF